MEPRVKNESANVVLDATSKDNFFDFTKAKVQKLTIEQLERTQKEHDIYDNPIKGIYHYELLRAIEKMGQEIGLNISFQEIFAANGGNSNAKGVVLLPKEEERYGKFSVEAHVLRRLYANMVVSDYDTDEFTTQLAVAFHQDGIQVGMGNQVRVCHNLTMLGNTYTCKTYGKDKLSVGDMLDTVKSWLIDSRHIVETDREKIDKMKQTMVTAEQNFSLLGMLVCARVAHDTNHKEIKNTEQYPLNQSQISRFAESLMLKYHGEGQISLWDWYNCATELYKPGHTEIPNIIPQALEMYNFVVDNCVIG